MPEAPSPAGGITRVQVTLAWCLVLLVALLASSLVAVFAARTKEDPKFAAPHVLLAYVFLRMGNSERARGEVRRGMALDPRQPLPKSLRWLLESPSDG